MVYRVMEEIGDVGRETVVDNFCINESKHPALGLQSATFHFTLSQLWYGWHNYLADILRIVG